MLSDDSWFLNTVCKVVNTLTQWTHWMLSDSGPFEHNVWGRSQTQGFPERRGENLFTNLTPWPGQHTPGIGHSETGMGFTAKQYERNTAHIAAWHQSFGNLWCVLRITQPVVEGDWNTAEGLWVEVNIGRETEPGGET